MPILSDAYDDNVLKPIIRIIQCPSDSNSIDKIEPEPNQILTTPTTPTTSAELRTTPTIPEITPLPMPKEGYKATKATTMLMKKAWSVAQVNSDSLRVHVDGGANRSLTNNKNQLINYKNIKKYPMSGISSEGPDLVCIGVGFFRWQSDIGELVLVK